MNQVKNISFYSQDAGKFLCALADQKETVDVVIMDPPRSGSSEEFLNAVTTLMPGKVLYISCNPETLARDLKYLTAKGYRAKKAVAFDLFPFAGHVETCCLLERFRNAKDHVTFTLDMEDYYRIKDAEADKEKR